MSTPTSPEPDVDAIEARAETFKTLCKGRSTQWQIANEDVPALVAEVRRLRAELEDAADGVAIFAARQVAQGPVTQSLFATTAALNRVTAERDALRAAIQAVEAEVRRLESAGEIGASIARAFRAALAAAVEGTETP